MFNVKPSTTLCITKQYALDTNKHTIKGGQQIECSKTLVNPVLIQVQDVT